MGTYNSVFIWIEAIEEDNKVDAEIVLKSEPVKKANLICLCFVIQSFFNDWRKLLWIQGSEEWAGVGYRFFCKQ